MTWRMFRQYTLNVGVMTVHAAEGFVPCVPAQREAADKHTTGARGY